MSAEGVGRLSGPQPVVATYIGVLDYDGEWPDLTPEGQGRHAELLRTTLAEATALEPVGHRDEVARAAMLKDPIAQELTRL